MLNRTRFFAFLARWTGYTHDSLYGFDLAAPFDFPQGVRADVR
ncbi:hypothetical protein IZ6_07380 [Terrihabitans soli]|uniref:Uncharacterized protein n=1 Tax=Terrihabitans soli TaxID=708113 RepID=A0A6S6QFX7_9HYPH|nr:hypothetical protein [Terrihabitans soli]BCJ90003.1 hypothetical protein IZ6_07380 [Terrihabitans soli]